MLLSEGGRPLRLGSTAMGARVAGSPCARCVPARRVPWRARAVRAHADLGGGRPRLRARGPGPEAQVPECLFDRIGGADRAGGRRGTGPREPARTARPAPPLPGRARAGAGPAGVRLPARGHEDWTADVYATREQVSAILAALCRVDASTTSQPSARTVHPQCLCALADNRPPTVKSRTDLPPAGGRVVSGCIAAAPERGAGRRSDTAQWVNEGAGDRILVLAVVLGYAALRLTGPWHVVAGAAGAVALLTAAAGVCPLYMVFGVRTCPTRAARR